MYNILRYSYLKAKELGVTIKPSTRLHKKHRGAHCSECRYAVSRWSARVDGANPRIRVHAVNLALTPGGLRQGFGRSRGVAHPKRRRLSGGPGQVAADALDQFQCIGCGLEQQRELSRRQGKAGPLSHHLDHATCRIVERDADVLVGSGIDMWGRGPGNQTRTAFAPRRGALVRVPDAQHLRVLEGAAGDLETERQPGG